MMTQTDTRAVAVSSSDISNPHTVAAYLGLGFGGLRFRAGLDVDTSK